MTFKDKASYGSSPPCSHFVFDTANLVANLFRLFGILKTLLATQSSNAIHCNADF